MAKYDPKSLVAEEFINHEEILETIEYAKANKSNRELVFSLIERAEDCKGLTHREAAVTVAELLCLHPFIFPTTV